MKKFNIQYNGGDTFTVENNISKRGCSYREKNW